MGERHIVGEALIPLQALIGRAAMEGGLSKSERKFLATLGTWLMANDEKTSLSREHLDIIATIRAKVFRQKNTPAAEATGEVRGSSLEKRTRSNYIRLAKPVIGKSSSTYYPTRQSVVRSPASAGPETKRKWA